MHTAVTASSTAAIRWAVARRDRAPASSALNTCRDERGEGADGEDLLGRAKRTGMNQVPEIAAGQNGDHRCAHLRAKKVFAADATGSCQCEACARPEHGG